MPRLFAVVTAGCAIAAFSSAAQSQVVTIGPFDMSGLQETTPNASPATGSGTLMLNTVTGDFTLEYAFADLIGTVTMAHFHQAPAGTNGGVVYWLASTGAPNTLPTTLMSPSLPTGVFAGSGSGTGTLSSDLIAAAVAGNLYVNIHTTSFGGGEIRGQVVPTPGAAALLGFGSLLVVSRRRR